MGVDAHRRARRRSVLVGVGLIAILGLLWAGTSAFREHRGQDLAPGEARYFNLPDGKAQIAVSTSGKDDLVVHWRDSDGATWTPQEVVYRADGRILTYKRIRVGGPTLAMFATYTPPQTYYDEEATGDLTADDITVFVVCRDGSCSTSRDYPGDLGLPPQVTPDGEHVLLAERDGTFVAWQGGGFVEQRPSGVPEGDYGEGQPFLAPDGSLRAVLGEPALGGCDYTLLTADPGEADFTQAAHHRNLRDHRAHCTTTLESFSPDYLVVSHGKYDAWFLAREGDDWRVVAEDPSGQVRYPRLGQPKLAGAYVRSGFWHWRQVVASSPDGHSLVVQVHFPGEERWGPPRVVARAPEGSQCTQIAPMPTYTWGEEDPFYINLSCRSRPWPGADWVYSAPTAVTEDGRTWHSFQATAGAVRVGRDLFFGGRPSYRWTPQSGLEQVRLPVPHGAAITLLDDGSYALSSLVESDAGCTVEVRLAAPNESTWSDPVPSTADPVRTSECAFGSVQGENKNVYHYFQLSRTQHAMVRLVWRDGDPILENGPA